MTRGDADPERHGSLVGSLVLPVILVAVAVLVGWALLAFAKAVVVTVTYAVGIAIVVVTAVMARRLVAGRSGRARWRRIGGITMSVLLGVALIVAAHEVRRHGWLLIAIPAVLIAGDWLVDRVTARR